MLVKFSKNFFDVNKEQAFNSLALQLINQEISYDKVRETIDSVLDENYGIDYRQVSIIEMLMYVTNNTGDLYKETFEKHSIDLSKTADELQSYLDYMDPNKGNYPVIYIPERRIEVQPLELITINANLHLLFEAHLDTSITILNLAENNIMGQGSYLLRNNSLLQDSAIEENKQILTKLKKSTATLKEKLSSNEEPKSSIYDHDEHLILSYKLTKKIFELLYKKQTPQQVINYNTILHHQFENTISILENARYKYDSRVYR